MKLFKLILLLLLGLIPTVQAQFSFTTNNGAVTITGYTGSNSLVTIPRLLAELPVTTVGEWAFYATPVANILVPDSVTNIEDGAFFDCQALTNVTVGSQVISIGDWAFGFCPGLVSVCCRGDAPVLGGGNIFYGNLATVYYLSATKGWGSVLGGHPAVLVNPSVPFTYTTNGSSISIQSYTGTNGWVLIPDAINFLPVTDIMQWGASTNVVGVSIPQSVANINPTTFAYCPRLESISVDASNAVYSSMDGVLFDQAQSSLLEYPPGKGASYTVPDQVANIGDSAFFNCTGLTNIVLSTNISSVANYAFAYCTSLPGIVIPDSVSSLGYAAFEGCSHLQDVGLSQNITEINPVMFFNCSNLTHVSIPSGVIEIGDLAFAYCRNLTGMPLPTGLTRIGNGAFMFCGGLTNVAMPNTILTVGRFAFDWCSGLQQVSLSTNLNSLEEGVLGGCTNLSGIVIPASVTNIFRTAFADCFGLREIVIPNSVSLLGELAFYQCHNLTNAIIGNGIAERGMQGGVFVGCEHLQRVVLIDGAQIIGGTMFAGCSNLTEVSIPDSVTLIGDRAFEACAQLRNIVIPGNISGLSGGEFLDCNLDGIYFRGKAPVAYWILNGPTYNLNTTVYYLPGTSGWTNTYGGLPTTLWLPHLTVSNHSNGVGAPFGIDIKWAKGQTIVVEACSNLNSAVWLPVQTNLLNSDSMSFADPSGTIYPDRFYRVRTP
jgi:hypothetical protein